MVNQQETGLRIKEELQTGDQEPWLRDLSQIASPSNLSCLICQLTGRVADPPPRRFQLCGADE